MTDINKTLTERGTRYGSFKDNGQLTQQLKQVLRQAKGWDGLDPIMQEALNLTCMKWSRIINGDPLLREFLEQHGCLDEYVVEHDDCTAEWFEQLGVMVWIDSFIWEQSPSGRQFWRDIHHKWKAHLEAKANR